MQRVVRINASGLRIGEDHQNAKLTDQEVDTVRDLLDERERFSENLRRAGYSDWQIRLAVSWQGLDIRGIAAKFEVSPSLVQFIHTCQRRAQVVAGSKVVHVPD